MTVVYELFKVLTSAVLAILTSVGLINPAITYEPLNADELLLSASVFSDTHIESNNFDRLLGFTKGLDDVANAKVVSDALVLVGDNTMNGQELEYMELSAALRVHNKTSDFLYAGGNHDICNQTLGEKNALRKFTMYYNTLTGEKINNWYYYKIINGYYFVVLGSEKDAGVASYLSPEQLAFADEVLEMAALQNKPVFMVHHQPMNETHEIDNWWSEGAMGEQAGELLSILKKYDNTIVFFSGHTHFQLSESSFESHENLHFVNLPAYGERYYHGEKDYRGIGVQLEVYETQLRLRTRSFEQSEWIEGLDYIIEL